MDLEGKYTKILELDTPHEFSIVDSLAENGWILATIVKDDNGKFIYWFQSKRRIYTNVKMQSKF